MREGGGREGVEGIGLGNRNRDRKDEEEEKNKKEGAGGLEEGMTEREGGKANRTEKRSEKYRNIQRGRKSDELINRKIEKKRNIWISLKHIVF